MGSRNPIACAAAHLTRLTTPQSKAEITPPGLPHHILRIKVPYGHIIPSIAECPEMFVTFPYGNNTATINVEHVTHVVWGVPVQGATTGVSVYFLGGQRLEFNLIPAQIQQLETSLAEYNRRKGG